MSQQHLFKLYVAGDGELSVRAKGNFDRIIGARLGQHCQLEVIDILLDPLAARRDRVVATPLLVRESPGPVVKILGDLSTESIVLAHLGISVSTPPDQATAD